ncbi:MAG: hypothetical protein ACRDWE_02865 [Acidimicrobiales bacterium]
MSEKTPARFRITVHEVRPDGSTKERLSGECSAYVVAISEDRNDNLRVFTDHDGPVRQRRRAIQSLMAHVQATIGLGR